MQIVSEGERCVEEGLSFLLLIRLGRAAGCNTCWNLLARLSLVNSPEESRPLKLKGKRTMDMTKWVAGPEHSCPANHNSFLLTLRVLSNESIEVNDVDGHRSWSGEMDPRLPQE